MSSVSALERAGPFNQFAKVPYSFGPRTEDWDSKKVILNDEPSLFYWNYKFNIDDRGVGNLWVADSEKHLIYFFSKETETWNAIFQVSGKTGAPGSRNGNIGAASFDGPEALAIHTLNDTKIEMAKNLKPVWMGNLTVPCTYID